MYSVYTINDTPIKKFESQKDLGITIDSKLAFSDHITSVTKQSVGPFIRLKEVRNLSSLVTFYKALISPKLEYCSPIWSMASPTHLSRLNSVLNFFLAIVRFRIPTTRSISKQDL